MCGTSPAAEVGNVHQLQPPANNDLPPSYLPATRHSTQIHLKLLLLICCFVLLSMKSASAERLCHSQCVCVESLLILRHRCTTTGLTDDLMQTSQL